ncbi:MAG TPA: autotransporter-associated beta strand repeat-containing protein [Candidatus Sulfopaludibacter sp.]|nr:autotransporter-associated beta strand repeat-containing protein [Candidatus Sulfopaludibacter sp.]
MNRESKFARLRGMARFGAVLAFSHLIVCPVQAAYDFWAGNPGVGVTTNWTDAANWTYAGQSSPQTYFNQVEFAGVGAYANNNFAVNNVLDNTTGVAQMPMWELDYIPTNGNYTTLINPGVTMTVGVGNHGYLTAGADQLNGSSPAPANAVETITITGSGGTLSMAGSGANLWVGQGSPTLGDSHNITLNLSGLDTFNDSAGAGSGNFIHVAYGNQNPTSFTPNENGTIYLARTNVISLGNDFQICNTPGTNSLTCGVYLGIYNYILIGTGNLIVGGPGTGPAGAVMAFNPAFVGGTNVPVAYLGGNGADGRIANFYIGYANGNSQVAGAGLCDFTGGTVTVVADTMQLGQGGNPGANSQGTLNFNNGSVNANNATIGNQEVSSGGTGVGIVNTGTNATLTVNNTLTLASVTGTLTPGTAGTININGGALAAGSIINGAGAGTINVTNGTFMLAGQAGTPATPVSSISFVNSTLNLAVQSASTNIVVSTLTTGGPTNVINITSVPAFSSYPVQIKLVKYPASIAGAGYNFGLGTLPPLCAGYLSNNTAGASVDLVLTSGPSTETWSGAVNGNWDTTTANWLAGGNPATYANGAPVQFFDGAHTGTVDLTTTLSPNGVTVSNAALNYTFNGSGQIGGAAGLLKQGSGSLVVDNSGNNNFSGGVTVGAGTLQVGNNDANGNLPSGAVTDNGVLVFNRTDSPTVGNTLSGSGALVQAGAGGTLLLSGANSFSGPVVVTNGSTLKLGSSSAAGTGTNNLTIASGSTLDANGYTETKPIIVSGTGVGGNGAITSSGGAIYDNPGPGLATNIMLAGNTTFLNNSPNRWDLGSSGGGSVLGALAPYNLTLNGNGGYFEWNNLSVQAPLANITIASGTLGVAGSTTFGDPTATLVISPSATLTFWGANVYVNKQVDFQNGATIQNASGANVMNGGMTLESGFDTFNIGGGTTLTLSNVLTGSGAFYQSGGSGTTILAGSSPSFTGGVLLYNGQLTLNGLIGSGITGQPGTTIYGSGTANGLVDVYGVITPGGASTAGTFNAAGGLTLESGAAVTMNLSPSTSGNNSAIAVTGNLTVNGNNITINPLSGTLAAGTYTLFTYTGSLSGTFGTASTVASSRYGFSLSTSTPHQVNLIVSGQPNLLEWNNGANNGQWDVQSSLNWSNLTTHTEDRFFTADQVLFDDTILSAPHPTTSIDIASGQIVAPSVVTNNSTANYTISGAGKISGAANIVKLGNSTLTMSTTNDFTGNFTIGGGTVQLNGITAVAGATNGVLAISNGATLAVNLSGSYPAGDAGFGNKPIVVSGSGANGLGAIQFSGGPLYSDSSTFGLGQNITLTGNTTISGAGRFDWGYPGAGTTLSTHGSNYNLTVTVGGYSQWYDIGIDTNLGNIDLFTSAGSQQELDTQDLGVSLGNPTNVLTLHSNILFYIQHGVVAGGDNGYAKIVHILPTATWTYQPSGGAGDYRLATSFVLETNAGLYFFSVNGGSGSGVAIAGTVTLNGLANFQIGNDPVTFSNVISGAGGFYLNQYGGSPLVFAAANTYQGITDIRSGMALALIGNGSISKSTPISLASGATLAVTNRTDGTLTLANGQTLQGSGTVQGVLAASAGSTVAPGTSAATGTLNVSGNATLNGNTVMKLNGVSNDGLSAGGTLTYGGTLTLTNISAPLTAGNSFTLFGATSYSGSFAAIAPATPGAGLAWNTNNLTVNGSISVVSTAAPVPHITKIGVTGTTLTVQGTNGTSNGQYVLLQSTNLALPLIQWTPALTNSFDSNGNFNLTTNIVSPNNPREFYRLKTQ